MTNEEKLQARVDGLEEELALLRDTLVTERADRAVELAQKNNYIRRLKSRLAIAQEAADTLQEHAAALCLALTEPAQ